MKCTYKLLDENRKLIPPHSLRHGEFAVIVSWPSDSMEWEGVTVQADWHRLKLYSFEKGDFWNLGSRWTADPGNLVRRISNEEALSRPGVRSRI